MLYQAELRRPETSCGDYQQLGMCNWTAFSLAQVLCPDVIFGCVE
jgi:hypothetical protein